MMHASGDLEPIRRRIITGLTIAAAIPFLAGCQRRSEPAPGQTETPQAKPAPAQVQVPSVEALSAVGRSEILAAAAAAADAIAAGNELPRSNLELTNRTFELRLPFACGDGILGRWGQWSLDRQSGVLRVTIRPQLWADDPTFKVIAAGAPYDAAEGFWIERPWTRSERCPAPGRIEQTQKMGAPASTDQQAVDGGVTPEQSLALVQFFSPDAPRTLRRGNRPYRYTAKLHLDQLAEPLAFRVKLVGRITGFADGQPIHCLARAPSRIPTCAVAVEFTQVALEDAVTGENLTEWGS